MFAGHFSIFRKRSTHGLTALAALLALALLPSSRASANCTALTQGDAAAIFNAFPSGGLAVRNQGSSVALLDAGPSDVLGSHGAIRVAPAFDGAHYCADDWHVILVTIIDIGDKSLTYRQAQIDFGAVTTSFFLDGAPLPTTDSAIQPNLNVANFSPGVVVYGRNTGKVMRPQDLGVGVHTLQMVIPLLGIDRTISFTIDPSGSPSCCH